MEIRSKFVIKNLLQNRASLSSIFIKLCSHLTPQDGSKKPPKFLKIRSGRTPEASETSPKPLPTPRGPPRTPPETLRGPSRDPPGALPERFFLHIFAIYRPHATKRLWTTTTEMNNKNNNNNNNFQQAVIAFTSDTRVHSARASTPTPWGECSFTCSVALKPIPSYPARLRTDNTLRGIPPTCAITSTTCVCVCECVCVYVCV